MIKDILLNGGTVVIIILYSSFMLGHFLLKFFQININTIRSIITGFTGFFSIFEILALMSIFFKLHFSALINLFGSLAAVIVCIATFFFIKNKEIYTYNRKIIKTILKSPFFHIAIILIVMQMFLSSYLKHTDNDDGYFITISNIALEEDLICMDGDTVYNGIEGSGSNSFRPQSSSWELFIAFFAKLFRIHPAVLAHTIMPVLLIALCYMAVYDLGKRLIKNQNTLYVFLIIYAVLNLFGGYAVYSSACFLLLRIWQGKAMLVNFAFPMLIGYCIDIYRKKENVGTWILNLIVVIAGIGFSVVGIYLMPAFYIVIGMPYLIYCGILKQWKRCWKLIIQAFVSMLPVILYILYTFYMVISSASGEKYMSASAPVWKNVFDMTMGQGAYFVLFLLSMLYLFLKKGENLVRLLFCGSALCSFFTFLNPYLCTFVAQKITGVDVYWRLYWMLPIYLSIAYVAAKVLENQKGLRKGAGLVMMLIIISLSGVYMYKNNLYFDKYENVYKIPEEGILAAKELLKREDYTTCIFPDDISPKIRQYTAKIAVIKSRGMSISEKYGWLYQKIYDEKDISSKEVKEELKSLNVRYIYSRSMLQADNIQLATQIKEYGYLYYIKE